MPSSNLFVFELEWDLPHDPVINFALLAPDFKYLSYAIKDPDQVPNNGLCRTVIGWARTIHRVACSKAQALLSKHWHSGVVVSLCGGKFEKTPLFLRYADRFIRVFDSGAPPAAAAAGLALLLPTGAHAARDVPTEVAVDLSPSSVDQVCCGSALAAPAVEVDPPSFLGYVAGRSDSDGDDEHAEEMRMACSEISRVWDMYRSARAENRSLQERVRVTCEGSDLSAELLKALDSVASLRGRLDAVMSENQVLDRAIQDMRGVYAELGRVRQDVEKFRGFFDCCSKELDELRRADPAVSDVVDLRRASRADRKAAAASSALVEQVLLQLSGKDCEIEECRRSVVAARVERDEAAAEVLRLRDASQSASCLVQLRCEVEALRKENAQLRLDFASATSLGGKRRPGDACGLSDGAGSAGVSGAAAAAVSAKRSQCASAAGLPLPAVVGLRDILDDDALGFV